MVKYIDSHNDICIQSGYPASALYLYDKCCGMYYPVRDGVYQSPLAAIRKG